MRHQIMRQGSLFRNLAHEHRDRAPDRLIDVNDENFVAISDENRATATGWEYGSNMYLNDRFVHRVDGTDGRTKNKPLQPRSTVSLQTHVSQVTASDIAFGAAAGEHFIMPPKRPEICCWFFFESTLHVPLDQQLSALQ